MNRSIRLRLFIMMVLEFSIWGAWLPLIYGYLPSLGFSASAPPDFLAPLLAIVPEKLRFFFSQQSLILNAFPAAAVLGMFFSNQYADRHFAAEKFLAFSHLIGGLTLLGIATIKAPAAVAGLAPGQPNPNAPFGLFFGLMLIHCVVYVPTISITNSIAFAQMKDAQKEFGLVRMGGTIGWILAAWPFVFILVDWDSVRHSNPQGLIGWFHAVLTSGLTGQALQDGTRWTYIVAGIASLVLAGYSLTLPHTPPRKVQGGADRFAWLESVKLLRQPFVLLLWLVTFIDAFVLYCYFNWTAVFLGASPAAGGIGIGGNLQMPVMSLGQIAEMLTMLILGAVLKRLGWRWTMVIGILGHTARFAVYAFWPTALPVVLVQLLHGICYAFFFATVYIFAEEYFPKDVRASAQGLFNVMILGLGPLTANALCPYLSQNVFTHNGAPDFKDLFLVPLGVSVVAALLLALFFRPPDLKETLPEPAAKAAVVA